MDTPDRRALPRIKAKNGHYASFPGGVAAIRNISLGGVMLDEKDPIQPGSPILLELHLGRELVTCSGVIKRSSTHEGTAVQFVEMSTPARKLLGGYLMQTGLAENRRRLNEGVSSAAREYRAASVSGVAAHAPTAARATGPPPRLGELLVRRGAITQDQLAAAMAAQQQHGGRFAAMLLSLGIVSEEDLVSCFHEEYRLPVIDLSTAEPTPEALRLVPRDLAIHHEALPIGVAGSTLTLAISDPSNLDGLNEVKFRSGCTLRISVAPVRALREAIDQFYGAHVRAAG